MHRRDWLRLVGAGAAHLATGCGDNLLPREPPLVAVLEPGQDGFLVALYDETDDRFRVDVRDDDGDLVAEREVELGPNRDGVARIEGLAPGRSYEVTVALTGSALATYRVRTTPADDDPRSVRIAVSADFDPNPMFESALVDHVLASEPDLFVSLGDFPYCDNGPAVVQDAPGYRLRHAEARRAPALRRLHAGVGVRAIYDDHEFRNDWNPEFVAREASRYAAAMQVWDEFFPLRDPVADIRYRSWRYGAHVECFLLDCRRFRSRPTDPDTAAKTMLGAVQRQWLVDGVRASSAPFKLIFTSVPLDFGIGLDHWKGYTAEREAIFADLAGIPGLLFVSADQHYFASHRHARGVRELQFGPLARGIGPFGDAAPGVLYRDARMNADIFEITGDELRVYAIDGNGEAFYEERLTADQLRPA